MYRALDALTGGEGGGDQGARLSIGVDKESIVIDTSPAFLRTEYLGMQESTFRELWNRGKAVAKLVVREGSAFVLAGQLIHSENEGSSACSPDSPVDLLIWESDRSVLRDHFERLDDGMRSLINHVGRYSSGNAEWRRLPPGWTTNAGMPVRTPAKPHLSIMAEGAPGRSSLGSVSTIQSTAPAAAAKTSDSGEENVEAVDARTSQLNAAVGAERIPETIQSGTAGTAALDIRAWLERSGWSASEAARRTGMSVSSISRWLRSSGPAYVAKVIDVVDELGADRVERWQAKRLTPRAMRDWVWQQGSQRRAASVLGVNQSQVSRWVDGSREVPSHIARLIELLGRQ